MASLRIPPALVRNAARLRASTKDACCSLGIAGCKKPLLPWSSGSWPTVNVGLVSQPFTRLHKGLLSRYGLQSRRKQALIQAAHTARWFQSAGAVVADPPPSSDILFGQGSPGQGPAIMNAPVAQGVASSVRKLPECIKLLSIPTTQSAKLSILSDLVTVHGQGGKTAVFVQIRKDVDDIATHLGQLMGCESVHDDTPVFLRERTLSTYRGGSASVLITTDAAVRGVDLSDVKLVIHYDLAGDNDVFVQRSSRTGRAGKNGTVILMHTAFQNKALELLERDLGCMFENVGPPSAEDVIRCSAEQAVKKLRNVSSEMSDTFLSSAEKLLSEQGPEVLAAALAQVCGFAQIPTSRSLITHEQGFMTLKVTAGTGQYMNVQGVRRFIEQTHPMAASSVRSISLLSGSEGQGAVFDLPEKMANEFLSLKIHTGHILEAPKKLPAIIEDMYSANRLGSAPFTPRGPPGRFNSGGFSGGGYSSGGGGYSSGGGGYSSGGGGYSSGGGGYSSGGGGYSSNRYASGGGYSSGGGSYSSGGGSYSSGGGSYGTSMNRPDGNYSSSPSNSSGSEFNSFFGKPSTSYASNNASTSFSPSTSSTTFSRGTGGFSSDWSSKSTGGLGATNVSNQPPTAFGSTSTSTSTSNSSFSFGTSNVNSTLKKPATTTSSMDSASKKPLFDLSDLDDESLFEKKCFHCDSKEHWASECPTKYAK